MPNSYIGKSHSYKEMSHPIIEITCSYMKVLLDRDVRYLHKNITSLHTGFTFYEGQSKITEPYLITFELGKMDIYLDDILLKLYVIYLIT